MKGVSPESFVADHLEDQTDDDILDDETTRAEIIAAVAFKPARGAAKKGAEPTDPVGKKIAEIKGSMEKLPDSGGEDSEEEEEKNRPAKKAKKSVGNELEICAKAMKVYTKMKNDDLKSVLRWNLGYGMSGTKDILLLR